ncbi:HD domain-containing protein [Desulfovibrio sp. OttesenSCG-928-G15]|nr:HD domain-containing protein [Desulfovibrio sp. OttesenSCG-928-G15]
MPDLHTPPAPAAKTLFVSDLSLGGEVSDIFILSIAQQGQAKNGPYWRLEFRDSTGSIGGKIWSPQSQAFPDLAPGQAVWVKGRVTSYRDKLELAVDAMRVLDEAQAQSLDMSLFLPASAHNPADMLDELAAEAKKNLHHKPWRKFVNLLLSDEDIRSRLRMAPAAKGMHHAFAGGLLEHTLSVVQLCMRMADQYPFLDRQTLFTGALCHDLGKLWELTAGISIDYTTEGRLIGHINLLMEKLGPFIKKAGLEPHLAEHLQHLILSHHGTFEFGSPRLPSTAEAFVLHFADDLDAKLNQVQAALAGTDPGGWSSFVGGLDRFLYKAEPTPEAPPKASLAIVEKTPKNTAQQPLSLFSQCSSPLKE